MMTNLKIATLNIRSLVSLRKRKLVLDFMEQQNYDVLCLQEVCFTNLQFSTTKFKFIANSPGEKNGTALVVKSNLAVSEIECSASGRIISARIEGTTVVNVYAPAGRFNSQCRTKFFTDELPQYLRRRDVVLTGDFNCVVNVFDRKEAQNFTGKRNPHLLRVIETFNLTDIWLEKHDQGTGHTLIYPKGTARLDRFYVTHGLLGNIQATKVENVSFSDHACVEVTLKNTSLTCKQNKQRKMWKMNSAVLEEEEYKERLLTFVRAARKHPLWKEDRSKWWDDVFKLGVMKITIDYCRVRKRWKCATRKFYGECMKECASQQTREMNYGQLQKEVQEWENRENRGIVVRSRSKTTLEEESASMYHMAKEKRNKEKTTVKEIRRGAHVVTHPDDICAEVERYFSNQFSCHIKEDAGLDRIVLEHVRGEKLSQSLVYELTQPITMSEAKQVLEKMKTNKAPGIDGIPSELYKYLWEEIKDDIVEIFNAIISGEGLTGSQKKGYVKLIPKTRRPVAVEDYRPITLLCADYKWLASILARRLMKVLEQKISDEQRGGIKGRRSEDISMLVRDILLFSQEKQLRGAIATLDFKKAFDRVSRNVIWKTMAKLGIPESFVRMLQILYEDVQAVVDTGVKSTRVIKCSSSIRQGCPLSVPLFLVYIDPLLKMLSNRIQGIETFRSTAKVAGFIDDITVFIQDNKDIHTTGGTIAQFCRWSGAMLNRSKSKLTPIGAWAEKQIKIPWAQLSKEIKVLGVTFQPLMGQTIKREWARIYQETVGVLRGYSTRCLTIHQKAVLLKTHVLTRYSHIAKILPCPGDIAEKILSKMKYFVWRGTVERTITEVLFNPVDRGGINLPQPHLFYRTLFLHTNLKVLQKYGSSGFPASSELMEYWVGFQLRKELSIDNVNRKPYKLFGVSEVGSYMINAVKEATSAGIELNTDRLPPVKSLYWKTISPKLTKGKLELAQPTMKWEEAWKNVKILPPRLKAFMFKVNHNILPTMARLGRIGIVKKKECPLCQHPEEDLYHIFLQCSKHEPVMQRVKEHSRKELQDLQDTHLVHLAFAVDKSKRKLIQKIAEVMEQIWLARSSGRTLTWEEVAAILT